MLFKYNVQTCWVREPWGICEKPRMNGDEAEYERIWQFEAAGAQVSVQQNEFRMVTVQLTLRQDEAMTVRQYPDWYYEGYLDWEHQRLNGATAQKNT